MKLLTYKHKQVFVFFCGAYRAEQTDDRNYGTDADK